MNTKGKAKKCQHLNATLTLTEETYHTYTFSDGKILDVDDDSEPDLTNALTFRCPDCREEGGWSDDHHAPSEIKALYQEILKEDYSTPFSQNKQEACRTEEDSPHQANTEREIEPGR